MAINPQSTPHPSRPSPVAPVPLALWPVAQTSAQYQRTGRYHSDSARHPGKMLPALAARIVSEYSAPGDLVCDPMCCIGTTIPCSSFFALDHARRARARGLPQSVVAHEDLLAFGVRR